MSDAATIKKAWYAAQKLRPYKSDADVLAAIIPPGGEWRCEVPAGAICRSVFWNGTEVAHVNPQGSLGDATEGDIAMGLRATPALDTALRVIHVLAADPANLSLIAKIAETAIAYIEMPAPAVREPDEDESEDDGHDDDEDHEHPDRNAAMNDDPGF